MLLSENPLMSSIDTLKQSFKELEENLISLISENQQEKGYIYTDCISKPTITVQVHNDLDLICGKMTEYAVQGVRVRNGCIEIFYDFPAEYYSASDLCDDSNWTCITFPFIDKYSLLLSLGDYLYKYIN